MTVQSKQVSFFLTPTDEVGIASEVIKHLPGVRLLDQWRWERADEPPVRTSPLDCAEMIGIWGSHISSSVTGVVRENGKVDGPYDGPIVQWERCRQVGRNLEFGRWSKKFDSDDGIVAAYVETLWRVIQKQTSNRLVRVSGDLTKGSREVRRFRVGEDAYKKARGGEIALVADQLILAPAVAEEMP